jgi:hypothetical protein
MVVFLRLAGVAYAGEPQASIELVTSGPVLADRVLRRDDQRVQLGHRLILQRGLVA